MGEDEEQLTETRDRERRKEGGEWKRTEGEEVREGWQEDVVGDAVIGLAKENGHVVGVPAMRAPSRNGMKQGRETRDEGTAARGWEAGCSVLHRKVRTSALHPPAVAQCTLPCVPPLTWPVHGARAMRLDVTKLSISRSFSPWRRSATTVLLFTVLLFLLHGVSFYRLADLNIGPSSHLVPNGVDFPNRNFDFAERDEHRI